MIMFCCVLGIMLSADIFVLGGGVQWGSCGIPPNPVVNDVRSRERKTPGIQKRVPAEALSGHKKRGNSRNYLLIRG